MKYDYQQIKGFEKTLTVKDLITILSQFDQDSEIAFISERRIAQIEELEYMTDKKSESQHEHYPSSSHIVFLHGEFMNH